jgi:hypothetical protein
MWYRIKQLPQLAQAHPYHLALGGAVLLMFGTCAEITLLSYFSPLDLLAISFYAIAILLFIPALIKAVLWRKQGILQPFANGTVLLSVNHVLSRETREDRARGVMIITTRMLSQQVLFVLPQAGTQQMTVVCACKKELVFRVDSLDRRKARRIRVAAISLLCLLLSIALGLAISPTLGPGKLGWLWWVFAIVLLSSFGGFWSALQYCGVKLIKSARGHNANPYLEKDVLLQYQQSGQTDRFVRAVPMAPDASTTKHDQNMTES